MTASDGSKGLAGQVVLGGLLLVFLFVQRAMRRRAARLVQKTAASLRPYRERMESGLEEWNREITWGEVVDWILQGGRRGQL
jgi:hypothetical protein